MAVPDLQSLMLPLQAASDGKEHSLAEAPDKFSALFNLTSDDSKETPGSDVQT
jgi:restriction endonuclease Mrr